MRSLKPYTKVTGISMGNKNQNKSRATPTTKMPIIPANPIRIIGVLTTAPMTLEIIFEKATSITFPILNPLFFCHAMPFHGAKNVFKSRPTEK